MSPFDKGSKWANVNVKLGYDIFKFLPTTPSLRSKGTIFEVNLHFSNQEIDVDFDDMIDDEVNSKMEHDDRVTAPRKVKLS